MKAIEVLLEGTRDDSGGPVAILHGDKGVQCDHGVGLLQECRECEKDGAGGSRTSG